MYQLSIALGALSPSNLRDLNESDRAALFVRRAAAEVAYGAWLYADPGNRPAEPPWDEHAAGQLARSLAATLAATGFRYHSVASTETRTEFFLRNTRMGLLHGWRLAGSMRDQDIAPRHPILRAA